MDFRKITLSRQFALGVMAVLIAPSGWAGVDLTESASLRPSLESGERPGFGKSLVVDGDTMLVSRITVVTSAPANPVQVLVRTGSNWAFSDTLFPPSSPHSSYGSVLALSENYAAVSAPLATVGSNQFAGMVHLFRKEVSGWVQEQVLQSPAPSHNGQFGLTLILDGRDLFVRDLGKVHWYERSGGTWTLKQTINNPYGKVNRSFFGASLALGGGHLMIGVPDRFGQFGDDWQKKGVVLLYSLKSGRWQRDGLLKHHQVRGGHFFGAFMKLDGDRLAVATSRSDEDRFPNEVQFFVKTGKGWVFDGVFGPDAEISHIALRNNTLAYKSAYSDGVTVVARSGAAWDATVFRPGPVSSSSNVGDLALSEGQLFLGTPFFDSVPVPPRFVQDHGAVRVFDVQTTPEIWIHDGRGLSPPTIAHQGTSNLGQVALDSEGRRSFTLSNVGHAPLEIADASTLGEGFRLATTPPSVLLPGETFVCEVVFEPSTLGGASGKLLLNSNDTNRPTFEIHLTAEGLASPTAPSVPLMDAPRIVTTGESVHFRVNAQGTEPLTYQWHRNGRVIRGATDRDLILPAAELKQAGKYTVSVQNEVGKAVSPEALLAVVVDVPQGAPLWQREGRTLALSIQARGPGLQRQWTKDGAPISNERHKRTGVDKTKLMVSRLTDEDNGLYACQFTLGEAVRPAVGSWDVRVQMRLRVLPVPPQSWVVGQTVDLELTNSYASFSSSKWIVRGLPPGVQRDSAFYAPTFKFKGTPTKPGRYLIQAQAGDSEMGFGPVIQIPVEVRPLGVISGSYIGCVEPMALFDNLGGALQFSTTPSGGISGRVFLDGKTIRFRQPGIWSADPRLNSGATFGGEVLLPDTGGWKLLLEVNPNTAIATGVLKPSTGDLTLPVKAVRKKWPDKADPPPVQGSYTVAMTVPANGDPLGAACGRMTINSDGAVRWTGKAGDGTALTQSSALGTDMSIPLHKLLYQGRGSFQAWLQVSPEVPNVVGGEAFWVKLPATTATRNYRDGFVKTALQILGARYVPPGPGQLLLNQPTTRAVVSLRFDFFDGHLSQGVVDFDALLDVLNSSRIRPTESNPKRLSITVKPATGMLSGHWYEGRRRGTFTGVLLPYLEKAHGHALLPTSQVPASSAPILSGHLLMEAPAL